MTRTFFILLAVFLFPAASQAQTDCPFGIIDDVKPGLCARYIDTDSDDLCDLSEVPTVSDLSQPLDQSGYISEEELKSYSVAEVAAIYNINAVEYAGVLASFIRQPVKISDSLQVLHDSNGLCAGVAANLAVSLQGASQEPEILGAMEEIRGSDLKAMTVAEAAASYGISAEALANALKNEIGASVRESASIQTLHDNYGLETNRLKTIADSLSEGLAPVPDQTADAASPVHPRYVLLSLALIMTLLYLATYILAKYGKIKIAAHLKFWNYFLLITFLASGLSGLFLVLRINYGLVITLPFNILYWHVEAGIAMALISLFHIIWHWRYFMIRRKTKQ